jgi:hypothetical protein
MSRTKRQSDQSFREEQFPNDVPEFQIEETVLNETITFGRTMTLLE